MVKWEGFSVVVAEVGGVYVALSWFSVWTRIGWNNKVSDGLGQVRSAGAGWGCDTCHFCVLVPTHHWTASS